jgi:hypothetical protein
MKRRLFTEAVEAYKCIRMILTDEESRYNYALAKKAKDNRRMIRKRRKEG